MRIRAITPIRVGAAELARRQHRYDRLCPPGLSISLVDLPDGPEVPRALDTADDVRRSERLVAEEANRTSPEEFDAVLPDCVLDPAVGVVADAPVPVVGMLRLTAHLLAGFDRPFAAVTRNQVIADELAAKAAAYGLGDRLTDVRVLGLDVSAIPDDAAWADALAAAVGDLPVAAVLNGCSAVEVHPSDGGPVIIDPTRTALHLLGIAADLGLVPRSAVAAP